MHKGKGGIKDSFEVIWETLIFAVFYHHFVLSSLHDKIVHRVLKQMEGHNGRQVLGLQREALEVITHDGDIKDHS